MTVSEFQKAYEELVVRYSIPSLRIRGTYTYNDNGKYKTYFHTSDTVVLELETDISKTQVQSITVFCEPKKSVNIRSITERAAIAYALVVEILTPELTTYERGKILKSLSSNFKKSSVVEDNVIYKSKIYDGILMLSAEPKN